MPTRHLLLLAAGFAVAALLPPAAPAAPSAEMQRLAVWHGTWTYTGETLTTPLGPGAPFSGTMKGSSILNGFANEHVYLEPGPAGPVESRELCWYDPAAGTYAYLYLIDGYIEQGKFTMDGNVCRWESRCVQNGKAFSMRGTETVSSDRNTLTREASISVDGAAWHPYLRMTLTRAPALPSNPHTSIQIQ